jgi:hypothetical protein
MRISDNGLAHFAVDVRFMTALSANLPGDFGDVFAEISQVSFETVVWVSEAEKLILPDMHRLFPFWRATLHLTSLTGMSVN